MKMKNKVIIKIFLLLLFSGTAFVADAQKKHGWKLVWQDEFNYTGFPDAKKWDYETGYVRNNEQQFYTHARKKNVSVSNGLLTIAGKKEKYPNPFYKKGSSNWKYQYSTTSYTSASINTEGLAGWQYGRIEVKAKMPKGGGMWPAIWMMGTNRKKVGWPGCGEIDIMEFIGNHPTDIYGTIHFPDAQKEHRSSGGKTTDTTLSNQFHVYAIEWNKEAIDLYFDDRMYHHFVIDSAGTGSNNPFRKPFYLLINLAMGADWPGPIDDTILPQQFVVDYVRVYKKL
jgi:beta-glucanase (GH16 family)